MQLSVFNAKLDFSLQTFKVIHSETLKSTKLIGHILMKALSNIRMELKIEQIDRRLIKIDTRAHNERQWDGQVAPSF